MDVPSSIPPSPPVNIAAYFCVPISNQKKNQLLFGVDVSTL
jgi:hypothetical protein